MKDRETSVKLTLSDPDQIRQSKSDDSVYLFYLLDGDHRWICAVTKLNFQPSQDDPVRMAFEAFPV